MELLPQQDIEAYSEVDSVLTEAEALHVVMNANGRPVLQFWEQFKRHGATARTSLTQRLRT